MSQVDKDKPSSKKTKTNFCDSVSLIISPNSKDLGGFSVRRVLPSVEQRSVGPFVFFDHMGPADFAPGEGIHVRAHPHIGLSTITYLFSGEIFHKDSLGYEQVIQPGAINFMTAGRGIVHAEKTRAEVRAAGQRLHGLQLWMALPEDKEEVEPSFQHFPQQQVPQAVVGSARVRVMIGDAFGLSSSVKTQSPTLYCEVQLNKGDTVILPLALERALYVVDGELLVGETKVANYNMAVLNRLDTIEVKALSDCRFAIVGGDPVGPRHVYWNFVSSSTEKIEQAKLKWQNRQFDAVPGETEFIPLPES